MVRKLFICPLDMGDGDQCRTLAIPNSQQWLGIFNAALLTLANTYNYEQLYDTDLTPEECAAKAMEVYTAYLSGNPCATVPSPYWDDATDNELQELESEQTWYGTVTDWLAPIDELNFEQNIAVWVLTGFVAYAAGVGAAIFFRTTARKFVIAVEGTDIPEIIRIVVDSANYYVDTTGKSGQVIEQIVAGDPDLEEHDVYVIKGDFP